MPLSNYIPSSKISQPGVCTSSTRPATPYEGQTIYETDTDKVLVWNGSAWYPNWNLPWGVVARQQRTNATFTVTPNGGDQVVLTATFTAISGRLYYAVANSYVYRATTGYVTTKFLDASNTGLSEQTQHCGGGQYGSYMNHLYFTASGSYSIKTAVNGDGSGLIYLYGSASYPHQLIITDVGPA
jgi:hypothetical protein